MVKVGSKFIELHCASSVPSLCAHRAHTSVWPPTSPSMRRADKPRPSCSHARPYPHGVVSVFAIPFLPRAHAEPSSSSGHRRRPRRPSSPPCLDSLRPEPHNLALCLLHPFPSSFEPTPGRIDLQSACVTGRHCLAAPELRPSVDLRPPVHLRSIQAVVSSALTYSISPSLFPSLPALPSPGHSCAAAAAMPPPRARRGATLRKPAHPRLAPRGRLAALAASLPHLPVVLRRAGKNTARRRAPLPCAAAGRPARGPAPPARPTGGERRRCRVCP